MISYKRYLEILMEEIKVQVPIICDDLHMTPPPTIELGDTCVDCNASCWMEVTLVGIIPTNVTFTGTITLYTKTMYDSCIALFLNRATEHHFRVSARHILAHELRHVWQVTNMKEDLLDSYSKICPIPWRMQVVEIDAENYASSYCSSAVSSAITASSLKLNPFPALYYVGKSFIERRNA